MVAKTCRLSESSESDLSLTLCAADDELDINCFESDSMNFTLLIDEMCGWIPDMRINYRITNEQTQNRTPKSVESSRQHTLLGYAPTPRIDYEFRHYTNMKKYIEQYRRYHTCCGLLERLTESAIDGRYRTVYYAGEASHDAGFRLNERESAERSHEHYDNELRHHGITPINLDDSKFSSVRDRVLKKHFSQLGLPLTVDVLSRHTVDQTKSYTFNGPKYNHEITTGLKNRNLNLTPGRAAPSRPQLPYFPTQTPKQAHRNAIIHDRTIGMFGNSDGRRQTPSHPYDLYSRLVNAVTYLRAVKEKDFQMLSDSLIPIRSKSPNLSEVWIRGKRFMTAGFADDQASDVCLPPLPPSTQKLSTSHHIGLKLPVFMRRRHTRQTIPSTKTIRQGSDVYKFSLKGNAAGKKVDEITWDGGEMPDGCQGMCFDCNESIRSGSTSVKG